MAFVKLIRIASSIACSCLLYRSKFAGTKGASFPQDVIGSSELSSRNLHGVPTTDTGTRVHPRDTWV